MINMSILFTKMHGLGNDFVVIDATKQRIDLTQDQIRTMADRRYGIGFDQLLLLELSWNPEIDFNYRIFNADGAEVEQCGNGARCIARYVKETGLSQKQELVLQTLNGQIKARIENDNQVMVEMGVPYFEPQKIPFVADKTQLIYSLNLANTDIECSVVGIGNPHAIIFVDHIDRETVCGLGGELSVHPRFPQGVNVGFLQLIDSEHVLLRVYERGVGETQACGSAACAAVICGKRRGLLQDRVRVSQPGGDLFIHWPGLGSVVQMTGPAVTVYRGELELW